MKALVASTLLLASCYSPEALDCTVTCAAASECAEGQVCGSDGFCAAPSVAGHCGGPDGGMVSSLVSLRVRLEGPGKVTVDEVGLCDSETADSKACMFSVHKGVALHLKAQAKHDREFVEWTIGCSGSDETCSLTPVTGLTEVGAKFE